MFFAPEIIKLKQNYIRKTKHTRITRAYLSANTSKDQVGNWPSQVSHKWATKWALNCKNPFNRSQLHQHCMLIKILAPTYCSYTIICFQRTFQFAIELCAGQAHR